MQGYSSVPNPGYYPPQQPGGYPQAPGGYAQAPGGYVSPYPGQGYTNQPIPPVAPVAPMPVNFAGITYVYVPDPLAELAISTGVLIREGCHTPFTIKQTEEVMRHKKEFTSDEIRFQICNHIEHPCGYGVWDGNDAAMDFVVSGSIPIHDGDIIILYSDGADDLIDNTPTKIMIEDSPESICERYCGDTSNRDDLSIVKIRCGECGK